MGDADCTYDFRELAPFVEKFRAGHEFIMGSRFRGSIEHGRDAAAAPLPRHARHDLDPQRALRQPLLRHPLRHARHHPRRARAAWTCARSPGSTPPRWCSSRSACDLRTAEVPVHFLKDREGRLSHHKRSGWFSPWKAAWINLRAMFVYGADFFLLKPGIVLLAARAAAHACRWPSGRSPSAAVTFDLLLDAAGHGPVRPRPAELLPRAAWPRPSTASRSRTPTRWLTGVPLYPHRVRLGRRCSLGASPWRCRCCCSTCGTGWRSHRIAGRTTSR